MFWIALSFLAGSVCIAWYVLYFVQCLALSLCYGISCALCLVLCCVLCCLVWCDGVVWFVSLVGLVFYLVFFVCCVLHVWSPSWCRLADRGARERAAGEESVTAPAPQSSSSLCRLALLWSPSPQQRSAPPHPPGGALHGTVWLLLEPFIAPPASPWRASARCPEGALYGAACLFLELFLAPPRRSPSWHSPGAALPHAARLFCLSPSSFQVAHFGALHGAPPAEPCIMPPSLF